MTTLGSPTPSSPEAGPPAFPAPAPVPAATDLEQAWPLSRVAAVTVFVGVSLVWLALVRVVTDPAFLCLWLACGVTALSAGRPGWYRPLLDWMPFIVFILAYQRTRGLAFTLGLPTLWELPITFDTWLGGGVLPGVWLQQQLLRPGGEVAWWELPLALVYMSHYFALFLLAARLRRRHRGDFVRLVRRAMIVLGVSACVYVAVPTAPPWAAASCSAEQVADRPISPSCMYIEPAPGQETLLGPIRPANAGDPDHLQRLTARGLEYVSGTREMVSKAIGLGFRLANPVAALPSLHAALAMLVSVFAWGRVRRRWWPLLTAYPLAMAFTLVWTGDHYLFDVLAGWGLVAAACVGMRLWERRLRPR